MGDRPDKDLTEEEFRQRMWDIYVKPHWQHAHEFDRPVRFDWLFWVMFVGTAVLIGVGVRILLYLTEGQ